MIEGLWVQVSLSVVLLIFWNDLKFPSKLQYVPSLESLSL